MHYKNQYDELTVRLKKMSNREKEVEILFGVVLAALFTLGFLFLLIALEAVLHSGKAVRTAEFFLWLVTVLSSVSYFVVRPVFQRFNPFKKVDTVALAKTVGERFPQVKDDLANSLQLYSCGDVSLFSGSMIEAAFEMIYEKARNIRFEDSISFRKPRQMLFYTLFATGFFITIVNFFPALSSSFYRITHFNQSFLPPPKYTFEVSPGNCIVTKGEDVEVKIKVGGASIRNITIFYKDFTQPKFERQTLEIDSVGLFNYKFYSVRTGTKYYATAENVESEEFNIEVTDKPVIRTFTEIISPPGYSGIQQSEQKDNGNIAAMVGSVITISLQATKDLTESYLYFEDSTKVNLEVKDNFAKGSFAIRKDIKYQIVVVDKEKNQNPYPIAYTIKTFADTPPSIEVIAPNKNVDLGSEQRISTLVKIKDDYGISSLVLKYRLSSSKSEPIQNEFSTIAIPFDKNSKESTPQYIWNLSPLLLSPEDVVSYYFEVADNDVISGPKYAKSPVYTARIPSVEELFKAADKNQKNIENDLKETAKEAAELKKEIEKIDKNLKQDSKDISYEEKTKIEQTIQKFNQLQSKAEDIEKKLDQNREKMQENNLLSKETLQKYFEMQDLIKKLSTDEMKKAMEKLQNSLQNMNRKQVQQEMQNFKMDEEAFQKSIERTINLLKRVQAEAKLDEIAKRNQDMLDKQEQIQKETENSDLNNQQKNEALQKAQEEISKQVQKMEQAMKDLKEMMKDLKDLPNDKMEEMQKEFEKQENEKISEESKEMMKSGQKSSAMKSQQKMSKNLKKMSKSISEMQKQMQQANQQQALNEMMKIINNLVELSKQQEDVKNRTSKKSQQSQLMQESRDQDEIKRNLDKTAQMMSDLGQKTFAITPEMGKALGTARKQMEDAIQQMQNNNTGAAVNGQNEAMSQLNSAALMMKSSMESMMQDGQGGGMMSLMQQLGKLSGQQMSLNNQTQQMQQGNNGQQMSQEQMGQMQRLQQQQEMIRKSIEQLEKEARNQGKSKSMPANLDQIAKEMQEVITGMKSEKIDDNLVQKQEKILSKMLDAQRSMNERDYEKERKSDSGKNISHNSPADLNLERSNKAIQGADELNRASKEGYSKDYENLIKKYFEKVLKN